MPTATALPTWTPTLLPTPEVTPALSDTGWVLLPSGLEKRLISIYDTEKQVAEVLHIFRLNQSLFRLAVSYSEIPKTLDEWQSETNAVLAINGGYFRVENETYIPNGLTIADGKSFGNSYDNFAGMLAITERGAEIRWLADKPYNPNEELLGAVQSFPLLVKPGGKLGFPIQYEDNVQARRTVIGQDKNGNILLMITPKGYFTLHQLSVYLSTSDLNLDIAVNLDGGPSTGVVLKNDSQESIPAPSPLPVVILVYPRR
jgi:Exopolysaccharide biosynthesis protein related to N-acetylglucosamine-1-phosphodiester alpha-N-acetylglucosaminidase